MASLASCWRSKLLTKPLRSYSVLTSSGLAPSSSIFADPTSSEAALAERKSVQVTPARPEDDVVAAGIVSGGPNELAVRPARIFRPSPTTMQSAKATTHHWRIDWDILPSGGQYENPLMGWAASSDYLQGTHIKFKSKADAIHFCQKQGYPYYIQEPHQQKFKSKSYSNNFLYSPGQLRLVRTK